jgi:hypothetical protein
MSEDIKQNNKSGPPEQTTGRRRKYKLILRILKWIGLGLLVALIIGALAFDAPWKVIALLLITLAAHTVLPKGAVKWFWLSVGAIVIVLIIWVFLPEDDEGWRPYTFDKELAALQTKYTIPDEENAAVIYNRLLVDYNEVTIAPNTSDPNVYYLMQSEPWSSNDYPQVAEWLKSQKSTIAKLIEASKFEKCRFPVVTDIAAFSQHTNILSPMHRWAFLLMYAANNDIAEGRVDQAVEKDLTVIQMSKHMCQQPANIDVLTGFGLENLGLKGINNFLVWADANESQLNKIEQAVSTIKHDLNSDIPAFIALEKLMLKNMYGSLFYEANSKGETRLSRDPMAAIREQTKEHLAKGMWDDDAETRTAMQQFLRPPGFWKKRCIKMWIIPMWFFIPETPEKMSRTVNEGYEKLYMMTKPVFDWSKEPQEVPLELLVQIKLNFRHITELTARSLEKLYFELHDNYLRNSAKQRGTLLIIALRRYKNKTGHWPENLEEAKSFAPAEIFVDPISGDSFFYKRTEDNFTLYSKGKNGIDEGGEYETKSSDDYRKIETIKDDLMIWPIKNKTSTQQEVKENDQQQ